MTCKPFYCAGTTRAITCAKQILEMQGIRFVPEPAWNAKHLLLDVPSFRPGGLSSPDTLLAALPKDVTVWGGNLEHPALTGVNTVDLLKEEAYLQANAEITARCARNLAIPLLHTPPEKNPVLIIGWGRIGKYLARILKEEGYPVTISTRKKQSRCDTKHAGYAALDSGDLTPYLGDFRLIFNTAPATVLTATQSRLCKDCIKLDLATKKGIAGEDVIWARGLPGIHAPQESGALIAATILKRIKEESP